MITEIVQLNMFIFVLLLWGLIYGYGLGKRHNFKTYKYYQNNNILYLKLLILSFLVAMVPFVKFFFDKKPYMEDGLFFVFFIYLLLFKIMDRISRIVNKRPMYVTSKGSAGNWIDFVLTITLIFSSLFLPLPLGVYFFK